MKTFYIIIIVFPFFLLLTNVYAQDKIVHGYVTAFDNIPVAGAEVEAKGTKQLVVTDTMGYFAVICNFKDKLIVNANGFYKQKLKLNKQTKLAAINLKLKSGEEDRFIATGYDYVKDKDKINAVANINNEDFNFSVYNDIYELIQGRIPGVLIENGEVIIRGVSSVNCSNSAMIVVDGITANTRVLGSISPNEVKNISVIKDGSAAIYGFQGVNGVLIIETIKPRDIRN